MNDRKGWRRSPIAVAAFILSCGTAGAAAEMRPVETFANSAQPAVGSISDPKTSAASAEVPNFTDLPRLSFPRDRRSLIVRLNGYPTPFVRDPDQSAYTLRGHELIETSALTRDQLADVLRRIRAHDADGTYWVIDDTNQQVHLGHFGGVADGRWTPRAEDSVTGTDNHDALQAFIRWRGYFQQPDAQSRKPVLIPPGVWRVDGQIKIDRPNVSISGYGATVVGGGLMWFGNQASKGLTIAGLKSVNNSGRRAEKLWSLYGARSLFVDTEWVYDPQGDFQLGFVWPEAEGSRFLRYKSSGGSETVIYASNTLFDGFDITGIGGDDGFVIKAPGSRANNISIVNGTIRDSASILSIGSEIGARGADDRTYSHSVRSVRVSNVRGENVAYGLYIKPGAIRNDYRFGLVEKVDFQAEIEDLRGAKFRAGARIDAARGAIVRDIDMSINIRARALDIRARNAGLRVNAIDKGGGAAPPTIERIKARLTLKDVYQGRPNGPTTPGYPFDYAAHITAGQGATVGRIDLWLDIDGTRNGAIINGRDVRGPVVVHSLVARNLCNRPVTRRYDSVILAGSPVVIEPGAYQVSPGTHSRGCARAVSVP